MLRKCAVCLAIVAAAGVSACNRGEAGRAEARPRVALVLKTLNSPFFIEMQRGAEEAAKRLDVDLVVQAAEREVDVEKQMQIIENLIQAEVSALAVTPAGSTEIVPAHRQGESGRHPGRHRGHALDPKAATDAGVKTVDLRRLGQLRGGQIVGEYLVKATGGQGQGRDARRDPGPRDRRLAGPRVPDAIKATPGVKIVASQTANWERDQGFTRVPEHAPGASGDRHRLRRATT